MNHTTTSTAVPPQGSMPLRQLWAMLTPWRWWLALVGISVLLGAVVELAPPLLVQKIVDAHLVPGRSEGLLWIAVLYLGATAVVQCMGFLTEYLTATIAQGVLRRLRVRLFAHLQTLPLSYYDRTPLGDTISRCTADVETVSTLFTTAAAGAAVASSGGGQAISLIRNNARDQQIQTLYFGMYCGLAVILEASLVPAPFWLFDWSRSARRAEHH